MFWMQHPRLVGFLVALPAIPAMAFTVDWALSPGASVTPAVTTTPAIVRSHDAVRTWLDAEEEAAERREERVRGVAPAGGSGSSGLGIRDARRISIYRDGVEVGWVDADRRDLAAAVQARLGVQVMQAEAALAENLNARTRFAEADRLSRMNAERRARGGRSPDRGENDLLRIRQGAGAVGDGAVFQRPQFVRDLARERDALRRQSSQRSRGGDGTSRSRR
jgi:hypothetical protein